MAEEWKAENISGASSETDYMYRALVTHSPDAIILHQEEQFIYANPAAIRMFCAKDEPDLLQYSLMDFIPQHTRGTVLDIVNKLQNQDVLVYPLSLQMTNLNGDHIDAEVTATSVSHNGKKIVQAMIRDVTHQKWIRDIQHRNHEWTIFREFIRDLADKTLNPLTVIEGFLTLLKEGNDKVSIDLLLHEAESIQTTWQRLISISQKQEPQSNDALRHLFPEN